MPHHRRPLADGSFPPPVDFTDLEADLWLRVVPPLLRRGQIDQDDIQPLRVLVRSVACYLTLTRQCRQGQGEDSARAEVDRWRRTARQAAADFGLVPANRVGFALLDADGEDVELKKIFGVPRP